MMTTLCLSDAVAPGWLILAPQRGTHTTTHTVVVSVRRGALMPVRFATRRAGLNTQQGPQDVTGRSDGTWRIERHVDDHAIDSGVEHPGVDLVGDRFRVADRHALRHVGGNLVGLDGFVEDDGDHHAGFEGGRVSADLLAPLFRHPALA